MELHFNWLVGLGIATTLMQGFASGTIHMTNAIPEKYIPSATAWAGIFATINSTFLTALMATGNGPVTGVGPAIGKAARALISFATVLLAFVLLAAPPVYAQSTKSKARTPLIINIPGLTPAPKAAVPAVAATPAVDPLNQLLTDIENLQANFITGAIQGLTEADTDAGTVINANTTPPTVNDPIAHACYPAQIQFLKSLPAASLITTPAPYNIIVLFQRKRDLVHAVQAGLPSYLVIGCAALLGDEAKTFISTMGLVGVKIAAPALTALMPAIAPITLPALALTP
jgi:hypothetical protein